MKNNATNRDKTEAVDLPDNLATGGRAGKLVDQPVFRTQRKHDLDSMAQEDAVQHIVHRL